MMNTEVNPEQDLQATLDRIVHDLDVAFGVFPEEALREARRYRQEITPRLIEAIRTATVESAAGRVPDRNLHFFAAYLLTEFRAQEAFPVLIESISLPGELPFDLYGDAITQDLPAMLVTLVGDGPELLEGLMANRELNEFVRSAAIDTFLRFVRDGRMTRDDAIERLRFHLREAIQHRDEDVGDALVFALDNFAAQEAMDEIREAYRLKIVDPFMIGRLADIEREIAKGDAHYQESLERCWPSGIDDVIEHLRRWYCFSEKGEQDRESAAERKPFEVNFDPDLEDEDDLDLALPHSGTIVHDTPRVGRNDRCPCGSGKKFKKCCGGR
ncbi:MAG: DUF1186 domain-containing protein [Pirellulales bacterium]|nr:DUF1186 domain-containing protein [Pirellulales bacterium]